MTPAAKALVIAAIRRKAQADWSDRAHDIHKGDGWIGGIQVGYDRAIAAIEAIPTTRPITLPHFDEAAQ